MPGLLLSQSVEDSTALVIGSSPITWSRIEKLVSHGSTTKVIVISPSIPQYFYDRCNSTEINGRSIADNVEFIRRDFQISDLTSLGREEVNNVVDLVFVTMPASGLDLAKEIHANCRRLRIPVNVADHGDLCTFTMLSTYQDGDFQLGITTNGQGCRLANRLKRHLVSSLPPNTAKICSQVGALRKTIKKEDGIVEEPGQHEEDAEQTTAFNQLVSEEDPTKEQSKLKRARWLAQVIEYFPLKELANISVENLVEQYHSQRPLDGLSDANALSTKATISLVGAGPGSASLLTTAALDKINTADVVLADKLVPEDVLDIIPKHIEVVIAKKFPGNAERAQQELLELGIKALNDGKNVVRLKQGDPYIFGRGGEEFEYFSKLGYTPEVVPGITSALAAPLFANIPATQRAVADQVLICTGTGRKGVLPNIPEWCPTRTTVILMGLHRIAELTQGLQQKQWDFSVPCCIIERASCPDQRLIYTSLEHVVEAVEVLGSRPPGLLVIGYSCEVLFKHSKKWTVKEGL